MSNQTDSDLPLLRSRVSDFMDISFPFGSDNTRGPCTQLQINYLKCMAAYGKKAAAKKCKEESEDYHECFTAELQRKRFYAMKQEREKQGRPFMPIKSDHIITFPRL